MAIKQEDFFKEFEKAPIVGILRGYDLSTCIAIAECYTAAGLKYLEITMNTPEVEEIISTLNKKFPQIMIGAGTVLDKTGLQKALSAGAKFIVTPIVDKEVISACVSKSIPVFPGAYTPTEIYQAWSLGAWAVKVFPATQLGTTYIKDVLAPLNGLKLLPTGGVSKANILSFFEAGATGVGMGSSLINKTFVQNENWESLTAHFKEIKAKTSGLKKS